MENLARHDSATAQLVIRNDIAAEQLINLPVAVNAPRRFGFCHLGADYDIVGHSVEQVAKLLLLQCLFFDFHVKFHLVSHIYVVDRFEHHFRKSDSYYIGKFLITLDSFKNYPKQTADVSLDAR